MEEITLNGFTYHPPVIVNTQLKKLDISHNKPQPAYLYKYYCLKNYNVNAVINNYLYAAQPCELNDKYDCSPYLIDYSKCGLEFYQETIETTKRFLQKSTIDEKTITHYYNSSEKWRLERHIANINRCILFSLFRVISLTSEKNNMLMWTHYANNNGFMIKINPSLISHENLYGPYPINYCKAFPTVEYDSSKPPAYFVPYQSNVKSEAWSYENEWRYVYYNPNSQDHKNKINNRLYYDKNALIEIVLGYDFFEPISSITRCIGFDVLNLKKKQKQKNRKLKRKLLNFIVESGVKVFQTSVSVKDYSLVANEISIEKLGSNTFKIIYK
jgi:hypothetical protein